MTVTFSGHRDFHWDGQVIQWLHTTVDGLVQDGADEFLLGGYGGFDTCAASVVWNLKQKYPNIRSTLVLPYLGRRVESERYDGTLYPPLEGVPKRYAILKRNEYMIDKSSAVVAYVCRD